MTENWRPIVGYEGLYEVGDQGGVRSLDRPHRRGIMLKLIRQNKNGHLQVRLCKEGLATPLSVHRLVLEAFVGPCPPGLQCLHYNDIAGDNRLFNLRWGTRSENGHDAVRNGRHPGSSRTHCLKRHAYTPENTWVDGRGYRRCRACRRDRYARRHGRQQWGSAHVN